MTIPKPNTIYEARSALPTSQSFERGLREPLALAALLLVATALVVGGVNRSGHHLAVQLAALPAFYLLLRAARALPMPATFALVAIGVAALQLVPMPWALWTSLPGHELPSRVLEAAGIGGGWRPISVDPGATAVALSLMFAPLTAYVAFSRLPWRTVRRLLGLIALFCAGLALFGVAQRMSGGWSLYGGGHVGYATGLMINRNHHADIIIAAILLLPLAIPADHRRETNFAMSAVLVMLAISVAATTSRAGMVLTVPALALALGVTWRISSKRLVWATPAMALIVLLLATLPQFQDIASRFVTSATDDRVVIIDSAWVAMRDFWPWGSGYGTFVPVYAVYEDLDRLHALYITAAHNDYLQLLLEGGLLALLTMLVAVLLILRRGLALLTTPGSVEQWLPFAVVAVLLAHSWVDYPLRMAALSVLFGACFGATESNNRSEVQSNESQKRGRSLRG
jgi:O-antigen ligase